MNTRLEIQPQCEMLCHIRIKQLRDNIASYGTHLHVLCVIHGTDICFGIFTYTKTTKVDIIGDFKSGKAFYNKKLWIIGQVYLMFIRFSLK